MEPSRRSGLIRKKARLEHQLAALDARTRELNRKRETRLKIIVGAAVLAHAKLDPGFAAHLNDVLLRAVVRPTDRTFLQGAYNSWRGAQAEMTKARESSPEPSPEAAEPTRMSSRSLKTRERYRDLEQL